MHRNELNPLLIDNNRNEPPNWDSIKNALQCEPIDTINGEPVYMFDQIFDFKFNPIEENIYLSQLLPSSYVPLHIHEYIELTFVYQGHCTIILKDHKINVNEGDLIMIDKFTPHTVKGITPSDIIINVRLRHDYFSSGFMNRFTKNSIISQFLIESLINSRRANNYLYFPFKEKFNIQEIVQTIMCEYFENDIWSRDMIDSYLFILFTELIRYSQKSSFQIENRNQQDLTVLDFLKYIEDHYEDCTLSKMADYFKYHPNYISAVIKKETGKTFKELLQVQRLNKAAQYLSNSNLPILEIAKEVGYSNLSFFYKKFHDLFSLTPKEYRDQNQLH